MRIENAVLVVLVVAVMLATLTGCPSLRPLGKTPTVEAPKPIPTIEQTGDARELQKLRDALGDARNDNARLIQRILTWGIPTLLALAVVGVALGLYLRNNLAFFGSAACGVGVLFCIVLLTFWKTIAWMGLGVVILAFVCVGILVAVQFRKMLKAMTDAGDILTDGRTSGREAKTVLRVMTDAAGVTKAINRSRGKAIK